MKQAACSLILAAAMIAGCPRSEAQSNVYSVSIYAGGVSSSGICVIGSPPTQFGIWRESYWTDRNGYTVMWAGSTRGIQPGDREHIETKVVLGPLSFRLPFPPAMVGALALSAILVFAFLLVGYCTRRHSSAHVTPVKS